MTPEQLATLKTYILANQDTATLYNELGYFDLIGL